MKTACDCLYGWIKKRSRTQKSHLKWWTPGKKLGRRGRRRRRRRGRNPKCHSIYSLICMHWNFCDIISVKCMIPCATVNLKESQVYLIWYISVEFSADYCHTNHKTGSKASESKTMLKLWLSVLNDFHAKWYEAHHTWKLNSILNPICINWDLSSIIIANQVWFPVILNDGKGLSNWQYAAESNSNFLFFRLMISSIIFW